MIICENHTSYSCCIAYNHGPHAEMHPQAITWLYQTLAMISPVIQVELCVMIHIYIHFLYNKSVILDYIYREREYVTGLWIEIWLKQALHKNRPVVVHNYLLLLYSTS